LHDIAGFFYYPDMLKPERLLFADIAPPGTPFHAALATVPSENLPKVRVHGHDFFEWMLIIDGSAVHWVNDADCTLARGQFLLMRPDDVHAIEPMAGAACSFINIAFPPSVWNDFVAATGIPDEARVWLAAEVPVTVDLWPQRYASVEIEAQDAVRTYHRGATRLAFSRFWNAAVEALMDPSAHTGKTSTQPAWLRDMLDWTRRVEVADLTVAALTQISGVTFAHLCRTMRSSLGVTPTQYINQLRLNRAAYELAATGAPIATIALDCGFDNLSYFYRRFHQTYGKSPRQYRLEAMRSLTVPGSARSLTRC
jgi:AraC-like DNA-binding protein/mannose-6-phosphate isomerase-like protein (cupin superfamily)